MDFAFSEDQELLRRTVREFAESEIAPHMMEWDEKQEFPAKVMAQLGELGIMGIIFPEEYGGAGLGYMEYALAVEELSRVADRIVTMVDGTLGRTLPSNASEAELRAALQVELEVIREEVA